MVQKVTESNFESLITSGKPLVIDFWAPWCQPCRMLGPTIEELSEEYADKVIVGKCNVDDERSLAYAMKVSSIPAVFFFKDGRPVDMSLGYVEKSVLESKLKNIL